MNCVLYSKVVMRLMSLDLFYKNGEKVVLFPGFIV